MEFMIKNLNHWNKLQALKENGRLIAFRQDGRNLYLKIAPTEDPGYKYNAIRYPASTKTFKSFLTSIDKECKTELITQTQLETANRLATHTDNLFQKSEPIPLTPESLKDFKEFVKLAHSTIYLKSESHSLILRMRFNIESTQGQGDICLNLTKPLNFNAIPLEMSFDRNDLNIIINKVKSNDDDDQIYLAQNIDFEKKLDPELDFYLLKKQNGNELWASQSVHLSTDNLNQLDLLNESPFKPGEGNNPTT